MDGTLFLFGATFSQIESKNNLLKVGYNASPNRSIMGVG